MNLPVTANILLFAKHSSTLLIIRKTMAQARPTNDRTIADSICNVVASLGPEHIGDLACQHMGPSLDLSQLLMRMSRYLFHATKGVVSGPFWQLEKGLEFSPQSQTISRSRFLKSPTKNKKGYWLNIVVALLRRFCGTRVSAEDFVKHCRSCGQPTEMSFSGSQHTGSLSSNTPWGLTNLDSTGNRASLIEMIEQCYLTVQQDIAEAATSAFLRPKQSVKRGSIAPVETLIGYSFAHSIIKVCLQFGIFLSDTVFHACVAQLATGPEDESNRSKKSCNEQFLPHGLLLEGC